MIVGIPNRSVHSAAAEANAAYAALSATIDTAGKLNALLAAAAYAGLGLMLPIGGYVPPLPVPCAGRARFWALFTGTGLSSAAAGGFTTPLLELLAEVSFPARESVTGNAVILFAQLGCLPLPALLPLYGGAEQLPVASLWCFGVSAACVLLTLGVEEEYLRSAAR